MYIEQPLRHYLDELASGQPTPGGGSTSALSGAMAAALASMVARLTLGKAGYEEAQAEIEVIITQSEEERQRFGELLEEDIAAYGRLSESYKLPRGTEEERAARSSAIQEHLAGAALVPLEVVETAARLSPLFARIAEIGNAGILSDLETAVMLANTAARGAAGMVRVNLRYMRDAHLVSQLQTRLDAALQQVEESGKQAIEIVGSRA
ncbi:MAG TPA: cyclodeaminase/cyclohydrolase family protein [Ktedonobacteraceae bacterium]|nr:cyclodeaminase/cyclohydrolase family protein [Ktedonobacteraceae bacterium]